MENPEISRVFVEIADLLEIKGEDHFRIRSYRNAALVVDGLGPSLKSLHQQDDSAIGEIPGIGKSIKEKIIELLDTGKCALHEELLKEVPKGVLELLRVPGIGPKKAAILFREVGVLGVDDLEQRARAGALSELPGFGDKTVQNILKGIRELRSVSGRIRLSVAIRSANGFIERLEGAKGLKLAMPCGSLRRWKDSIGDIDILAISALPALAIEAFCTHPEVERIVSQGETLARVVTKTGLHADLRVLREESFGAALQYFTGSKAHNVAMRERARRMGYKLSEYGVFRESDGELIAGKTEEEVYSILGLDWIPPELREATGEIEAAERHELPVLIAQKDIRGDLHVHTTQSDGASSLDEVVTTAIERGYEYVAITDHSKAIGVAHGLDEARVLRQIEAIDVLNSSLSKKKAGFVVLKGAEVDIRADGELDHPERLLRKLDCVVAAVHSGFGMESDKMTSRVVRAISSGLVHVLAHPTGRLIGARSPYEIDMEQVIRAAKAHNVALEINSYPERLDLNDAHARMAKDSGVLVAISTDAHSTEHFSNITYGVHTAMRAWMGKKDVLNAKGLSNLMKFLKVTR